MIEGTIIKGVGGQYTVDTSQGQYICNARGLFRKQKISPIVGDKVQINTSEDMTGMLMSIMPRINELRRPKVANVDQVVVVLAAAQPALSFHMLDHYLIQAAYEGIEAFVCINKTDLDADIAAEVQKIYTGAGYPVFIVSAIEDLGLDALGAFLQGKTTVLAGPSGVGKSSIINSLTEENLETGAVSEKIGRGKHTTRHTAFVPIGTGENAAGYVIDTPGFSSLAPPDVPKLERAALFSELRPWLGQCKFRDCLHQSEKDCAVKAQVGLSIDPRRYERYIEWINS
ncbi:MAG: ribosome small subunit-dependent GTPase A [Defluviitaleaceae bacterium]|nr:ribosome small subunit-dependent GTPase A [Defluviitaleaceae bacterium]